MTERRKTRAAMRIEATWKPHDLITDPMLEGLKADEGVMWVTRPPLVRLSGAIPVDLTDPADVQSAVTKAQEIREELETLGDITNWKVFPGSVAA